MILMIQKCFICFLLLLSLPWLGACKKDNDVTAPDISGIWVGQYGLGDKATGFGYKFFIDQGGDFGVGTDTSDAVAAGKGTWNLTGNTFRATYIYTINGGTFSVKGTLNNNTIDGTWGNGSQRDDRGLFSVKKNKAFSTLFLILICKTVIVY